MFQKIKEFVKKVKDKIVSNFRNIVKAIFGIGVSVLVLDIFKTVVTPGGKIIEKIAYGFEYLGAIMVGAILTKAGENYIDHEIDDFKNNMAEIQSTIAKNLAAAE